MRFLGVTVLPEYIQTEGVNGVLDRLATTLRGPERTDGADGDDARQE